jgi:hypothetical protein
MTIQGSCFGYCADLPVKVTWNSRSDATTYTLHYTNANKGVAKTVAGLTDPAGGYVIDGSSSMDTVCVQLQAVNKSGSSGWSAQTCYDVPM